MVQDLGRNSAVGQKLCANYLPGEEDSDPPSAASSSLDVGAAPENMETEMRFPMRKSKNDPIKREWDLLLLSYFQQMSAYTSFRLSSSF